MERVNVNIFSCKEKFRALTGGGHKIHSTNTPLETDHDLTLLLGINYNDYEKSLKIISKKHDLTGIKVYDKFEEAIPNLGLVQMFDQETEEIKMIDTSSKSLRDNYKREMSLNFKKFNDLFTKNGAGTISCRTDESYIKKLLNYFKNRG